MDEKDWGDQDTSGLICYTFKLGVTISFELNFENCIRRTWVDVKIYYDFGRLILRYLVYIGKVYIDKSVNASGPYRESCSAEN